MTFILLVALALSFELLFTLWGWAISNNYKKLAIIATALMPLVNLISLIMLIDATSVEDRVAVCIADSVGSALGAATILYLIPNLMNEVKT